MLSDLLEKGPSRRRVDKVQAAFDALDDGQKAAFRSLIMNTGFSNAEIAQALTDEGHKVEAMQVRYFRDKLKNGKVTL